MRGQGMYERRRRRHLLRLFLGTLCGLLVIFAIGGGVYWWFIRDNPENYSVGEQNPPQMVDTAPNHATPAPNPNIATPIETTPQPTTPAPTIPPFRADFTLGIDDVPWYLVLVNRYNFLPEDFDIALDYVGQGFRFDARAAQPLRDMMQAARDAGYSPIFASTFRAMSLQRTLFDNQVNRNINNGMTPEDAFEAARRVVAYPGSSEHNLGLAIDVVSIHYQNLTPAQGQTPEGRWFAQNAHRFGFILRYPYHKQDITNIIYEPWHFRYVGIPSATAMFYNDLVLEEYLWERIHRIED